MLQQVIQLQPVVLDVHAAIGIVGAQSLQSFEARRSEFDNVDGHVTRQVTIVVGNLNARNLLAGGGATGVFHSHVGIAEDLLELTRGGTVENVVGAINFDYFVNNKNDFKKTWTIFVNIPKNKVDDLNSEYTLNVQEDAYLNLLDRLKENNMEIENEVALGDIFQKLSDFVHPLVLGEVYRSKAQIQMMAELWRKMAVDRKFWKHGN